MIPEKEMTLFKSVRALYRTLCRLQELFGTEFTADEVETLRATQRTAAHPTIPFHDQLWSAPESLAGADRPYKNSGFHSACEFLNALPIAKTRRWNGEDVVSEYTLHPQVPDLLARWKVELDRFDERVAADEKATRLENIARKKADMAKSLAFWNGILDTATKSAVPDDVRELFEAVVNGAAIPVAKLNALYETYV